MLGHWSRSGNFLEQKVWWTDSKHRNSCKGRSRSGKTLYTLTSVYMFSILSSVNIFFGTDMKNLFKDQSFLRLVIISFVRMIQPYYCQEKLDHSSGFILSHMVQSTVILKLFFTISLPSRIITLLDWKEIILSCHFSLLTTWWKWRGKFFDKKFLFTQYYSQIINKLFDFISIQGKSCQL